MKLGVRVAMLGCLALLLLFTAILLGPLVFPIGPVGRSPSEVAPDPSLASGVRVGAGLYERSDFAIVPSTGDATNLALGTVAGDPREHLIVAGTRGWELRDPTTLVVLGGGSWMREHSGVCVIDLDGDGALEFATFGGCFDEPAIYDGTGKPVSYAPNDGPVSETERIRLGWQQSHFHVLGVDGIERRVELPTRIDTFERGTTRLVDTDGDGTPEILTAEGDDLEVRSLAGAVLRRVTPPDADFVNCLELRDEFGTPPRRLLVVGHNVFDGPREGQHYELYELDARTRVGEVTEDELNARRNSWDLGVPPKRRARLAPLFQQAPIAGYAHTRQCLRVLDADDRTLFEEVVAAPDGLVCLELGDVQPLTEPPGAFLAAYGLGLRRYVPATAR
ncbi:MAG: hypothetical protein HZA52_15470 [Planctomycetes bacterium]|nr:hypothetical protein [Planctomycetota bacterium]